MLNFSPEKLFLVGVIALVVLGPQRLPQAARTLGRFVAELRRISSGFQEEVRGALAEPVDAFHATVGDLRPPDVRRSVRDAITNTLTPPAQAPVPSKDPSGRDPSGLPPAPDDPSLN
jgi:sec-independent protein translocase protein TatB